MPLSLSEFEEGKLLALAAQENLVLGEVVAVHWPAPDGTKYYGSLKLDELPGFTGILNYVDNVEPRLIGRKFENVVFSADVSDETVPLNFSDLDGEITRLFRTHGSGARIEIIYYLPQIDWFVTHWFGHLDPPSEDEFGQFPAIAASGFRSAKRPVPKRIYQGPCQNQFGGTLATQAEIDESGCPYNRHIGGAVGNLNGGVPFTSCGKSEEDCIARLNDKLSHTGFNTTVAAVAIHTHGQTTLAGSKGNESTLKEPLRVIYGGTRIVRSPDLLAYRQEHNTAHGDQGFLAALFSFGEGPNRSMTAFSINQAIVGAQHLNIRLGTPRQPPTSYAPNVGNFSNTCLGFGRIGPLNPGGYNASNIQGQATIEGICDVRVYSTPDTFTRQFSDLRSWCLLDLYTRWRFGHGQDVNRFWMQDWVYLAELDAQTFNFTDPNGKVWTGPRGKFSADLQGRSAQEQISDICKFGRFTMPFQHLGKIRTLPYEQEPLEDVPVFTDEGPGQNILRTPIDDPNPNVPRIWWVPKSHADIDNELLFTFEEAANGNIERPQRFAEEEQQLRAGRAAGESSLQVVRKTYSALGITLQAQLVRIAWLFYHLGENDEGGTKNNCRFRLFVTFQAGFPLYKSQVIKLDAAKVREKSPSPERPLGFTYFRVIRKIRTADDLSYELIVQAYPQDYYEAVETVLPAASEGYEAESEANHLTGTAEVFLDPSCSGGAKVVAIGNGLGTIQFNGIVVESSRLYDITIAYLCDENLTAFVSLDGGASQPIQFPSSAGAVGEIFITRFLTTGVAHTLKFINPTDEVPDLDRIAIAPHYIDPIDPIGTTCGAQLGEIEFIDGQLRIPVLPCDS